MRGRRVIAAGVLVLALLGCTLVLGAGKLDINYPSFAKTKGLTLNGNAARIHKRLRLVTQAVGFEAGTVWTKKRRVDPGRSFHARFRFRMKGASGPDSCGDGLAFVLQPTSTRSVGTSGKGIGYGGLYPSIAVENDVFDDGPGSGDPNSNHLGVNEDGYTDASLKTGTPRFKLCRGKRTEWVSYNARSKRLKVFVTTGKKKKPRKALISLKRNLKAAVGTTKQYAGFTAATGLYRITADILSFRLKQP